MSEIKVKTIEPSTGTNLTLGTSGDTIAVSSDSVKLDTWKDSGGNTLFQSDGAGTLSNVNSSFSGAGPKLILSQTADASSSISFTSGIDNTYDKYRFVCVNMHPNSDSIVFLFNGSTDGGSNYNAVKTTTFFNAHHQEDDGDAGLNYRAGNDLAQSADPQYLTSSIGNGSDESASGILDIYSPSSTTYVKQFTAHFTVYRSTDEIWDCFIAGYMNTTSAVDAIQFTVDSGTFDGIIKMYGVD